MNVEEENNVSVIPNNINNNNARTVNSGYASEENNVSSVATANRGFRQNNSTNSGLNTGNLSGLFGNTTIVNEQTEEEANIDANASKISTAPVSEEQAGGRRKKRKGRKTNRKMNRKSRKSRKSNRKANRKTSRR